MIFEQEGNFKTGQYWHPYEVIELGASSLHSGHEREFVICTLLVIQAVVSGFDKATDLAVRREHMASHYAALPVGFREELANAYRAAAANYVSKPTAEDMLGSSATLPRSSGLTRR